MDKLTIARLVMVALAFVLWGVLVGVIRLAWALRRAVLKLPRAVWLTLWACVAVPLLALLVVAVIFAQGYAFQRIVGRFTEDRFVIDVWIFQNLVGFVIGLYYFWQHQKEPGFWRHQKELDRPGGEPEKRP
jgi:hypothetical protein